jgi:hypothetical protein
MNLRSPKKERNVKPVEESILSEKADPRRIHSLCETYGQLVLQHAGDLNLNIEKIGKLTARSCSTK